MTKAPYLIGIAALVAVGIVRLRRRSGRARGRPEGAPRAPRPAQPPRGPQAAVRAGLLGDTGLVAGRELRERLRGRFFRVITLVLLAVVAAAVVIPTLSSGTRETVRVGVVGTLSPAVRTGMLAAAKRTGAAARLVDEPDLGAARDALRTGHVHVVVDGERAVVLRTSPAQGAGTSTVLVARAAASVVGTAKAYAAAGLSSSQASALAGARALPLESLSGKAGGTERATSIIGIILVFIMLTQYLTWTLMGVMEEKSSRVVEVLLATVRPGQLLAGKVLGIGVVALLQAAVVVAFALALAGAVGSHLLTGTAPLVVVSTFVWLVLGYAFYSWVYAAAGSMADRQDQVQSLALPLSVPLIVGYVIALTNAGPAGPSLLVKVLAFFPPTAPFCMPLLVSAGKTAWWAFLLSALVSVACTIGVARVASSVYRRAVLRTGRRVRVREVLAGGA